MAAYKNYRAIGSAGWLHSFVAQEFDMPFDQALTALCQDEETLFALLQALAGSQQAIALYDADDRLRYANIMYRALFMADRQENLPFADILRLGFVHHIGTRIHGDDIEQFIVDACRRRRTSTHLSFEIELLDGRWLRINQMTLAHGWMLTIGTDISALKQREATLRRAHDDALVASRTDALTGLPNRRFVLKLVEQALISAAAQHPVCVAFIDIDRFKNINDTLGHHTGDKVLRHFASLWSENIRPGDCLGRLGGEEFLLLMHDASLDEAAEFLDGMRKRLAGRPWRYDDTTLHYTFSAGVTQAVPGDDVDRLYRRADCALYHAKSAGRDCVQALLPEQRIWRISENRPHY